MAVVERKLKRGSSFWVVVSQGPPHKPVWEHAGSDRRAADRLDRQRKREVAAGTYRPTFGTGAVTVRVFAERWGARRTNRTAGDDRARLRDHVLTKSIADMKMDEVEARHVLALVQELQLTDIKPKTIANVYGVLRTMFRDAHIDGLVGRDPCVLPRNTLKKAQRSERDVYSRAEIAALTSEAVDPDRRVFAALLLYTGAREGEICGLQWNDWDREAEPLGCLRVQRQYEGGDLKTNVMRKVPVHPELALALDAWWRDGFELVYCRKPTPKDHIVPPRDHAAGRYGLKVHHTRSSAYKMFIAACKQAGVEPQGVHTTRHSFITWARRGGARKDVLERITHNAKGDIVDQYTHFDWQPLCDVIGCVRFDPHQTAARSRETAGVVAPEQTNSKPPNAAESCRTPSAAPASIPGASTGKWLVNKPDSNPSQTKSQTGRRLTPARLLLECVDLATGRRAAGDAEAEVAARLRRVAKTLPAFAPARRAGGAS